MAVSASSSRPCTRPCRWVSILFFVQESTRACQRRLQKEQLEEDICSALKLGWCLHETNRRSATVIDWQKGQSSALKFNVGRIRDLSCYLDTYLFCLILILIRTRSGIFLLQSGTNDSFRKRFLYKIFKRSLNLTGGSILTGASD